MNANAGINFIHNHPPVHPRGLDQKFSSTLGLLHPSFSPGGGGGRGFVGIAHHFWNFHYNGKNWRLTTLLGFICCSEILCFKTKLFSLKIEPKLKNENDFSDQRLRMRNSLIVGSSTLENLSV